MAITNDTPRSRHQYSKSYGVIHSEAFLCNKAFFCPTGSVRFPLFRGTWRRINRPPVNGNGRGSEGNERLTYAQKSIDYEYLGGQLDSLVPPVCQFIASWSETRLLLPFGWPGFCFVLIPSCLLQRACPSAAVLA